MVSGNPGTHPAPAPRWLALLVLTLLLLGCSGPDPVGPAPIEDVPANATPTTRPIPPAPYAGFREFVPPPEYLAWWRGLEVCSHAAGHFAELHVFAHPDAEQVVLPGIVAYGEPAYGRIYFGIEAWDEQVIVAGQLLLLLRHQARIPVSDPVPASCRPILEGRGVVAHTGEPGWKP